MKVELATSDIRKLIPHRYPFLLVDRVTEIEEPSFIRGYKNISANEELFLGHFPQKPIFPGVLIIEAMAQLGAVLVMRRFPEENRMAYFAGIDKARFKRQVVPGDRLDLEVRITRERRALCVMEGKASVDGQLAAEAEMMCIIEL